jgi:hypothetical protein
MRDITDYKVLDNPARKAMTVTYGHLQGRERKRSFPGPGYASGRRGETAQIKNIYAVNSY